MLFYTNSVSCFGKKKCVMHRQRASSATCSIRGHVSWRISRFLGSRQLVHLKVTVHSGGETKYLPILIHRMRETKQNKNSKKKPSPNPGAVPFWLSPGSGRSREERAAGRAEAALAGAVGGGGGQPGFALGGAQTKQGSSRCGRGSPVASWRRRVSFVVWSR